MLQEAEERHRQADELLAEAEEKLRQAAELQPQTHEDQLTGLPNAAVLRHHLDFMVEQVNRYGRSAALLAVDLDRFRFINEALGFRTGDELLRQVAERLKSMMRGSDVVARAGEDEFHVLLSELSSDNDKYKPAEELRNLIKSRAEAVAKRVLDALAKPYEIQGQTLHLSSSIGLSLAPGDALSAEEMLEHADAALYSAKELGRARCQVYSEDIQERLRRRLLLENQLHTGLREGQFKLFYQPIVLLDSREVVGVEALVRWDHPEMGRLMPREFLPIAEESGAIVPLGDWILGEACSKLKQWRNDGMNLFIDVNLSPRQLLQADMAATFLKTVEDSALRAKDVMVDVGEHVYTLDPRVRAVLDELGESGVRIAIDDFGTGLSNLKAIRLTQTKIIKLDSTFVAGIPANRQYLSICVAVVRLAASLNMRSLAEGIETEKQYEYLHKNECHLGQGFYFSPPVEPEKIPALVREGTPGREILGTG